MIKRLFISLAIAIAAISGVSAQTAADLLQPLPEIPSEITEPQERADYLITHFWDKCNWKSALSSRQRFANSFDTYVDLMKAATRRATMRSIAELLAKLEKQPRELMFVGELAEALMQSDTAVLPSDEAFIPFARAIAANKKIDKAEKARFAEMARILGQSSVGCIAPDMEYADTLGNTRHLATDTAQMVIIFFNDPDCIDCIIARGRLAANPTLNMLIDRGTVKIVALTPDDATDEWRSQAKRYPANWIVGTAPEAYDTFDIRQTPTFYVLDRQRHIIGKNTPVDELTNLFSKL